MALLLRTSRILGGSIMSNIKNYGEHIMKATIAQEKDKKAEIASNYLPPRYKHDHTCCTYLGQYDNCDLYFCPQSGIIPTVIARYSDYSPDYTSGLEAGKNGLIPALAVAYNRAVQHG